MVRVGVVGLGFMGRVHFKNYKDRDDVQIAAVCDTDQARLKGDSGVAGNVPGAEEPLDFTGIEIFTDFDKMLAEVKLDAVSIALPTHLHSHFTVKALDAGLNVLCEKPMALDIQQCEKMITAAEKAGKILQIGHCIRFWPEYAKTKELVDLGQYGRVKAASFRRLSLTPVWSSQGWLMSGVKSGGAIMDLHIHDSDYVQYLFGMPKTVRTFGIRGPSNEFDHVITNYIYDDDKVISAEGGWIMAADFGFEMSFNIILEKATIVFDSTRKPAFRLCPVEGEPFTPEVEKEDGYSREIEHFIRSVQGEKVSEVLTPKQSLDSIRLVLAEKESAQKTKEVAIQ